MSLKENCFIELNFAGNEIIPEEITSLLKIENSVVGTTNEYCWQLIVPLEEDYQGEKEIEQIIKCFESFPQIEFFCKKNSVAIYLTIVLYLESANPAFEISSNLLKRLASFDITIDVSAFYIGE